MKNMALAVVRGATQLASGVLFGGFALIFFVEEWANAKQWERDASRK